jgi:hypothetical protein
MSIKDRKLMPAIAGNDELARLDQRISELLILAAQADANKETLNERINSEILIPLTESLAALKLTLKDAQLEENKERAEALQDLGSQLESMLEDLRPYTREKLLWNDVAVEEYNSTW